ncbi:MAG: FkbM family methyltransferase [Pseudomonadales bacterium]|nr:FkbM family methyltransferase [Pseudomonadales bacterium]
MQTRLGQFHVTYHNKTEYHQLKKEIFNEHTYYFETSNPAPVIIDAGAHIGLATLYFVKLYPHAQITAIEPNPTSFALLEKNMWDNNCDTVTTVHAALSNGDGETALWSDADDEWLSTDSLYEGAWDRKQSTKPLTVPTQTLSGFLRHPVTLVKLDIEGYENIVLSESEPFLKNIEHIIVEHHFRPDNTLHECVALLEKQFSLELFQHGKQVHHNHATRGLTRIVGKK